MCFTCASTANQNHVMGSIGELGSGKLIDQRAVNVGGFEVKAR